MKYKTIFCFVIIFLLFPVVIINAASQSFFVTPGQSLRNGGIARMYCLEFSKEVMKADNLSELTNILGDVRVLYKDGTERVSSFNELYKGGKISIIPMDSHESMRIDFLDESIDQITVADEGLSLFRGEMTDHEIELSKRNIERIHRLEALGIPRTQIQEIIWDTVIPFIGYDTQGRINNIDFHRKENEDEKIYSTYGNSGTVSYQRAGYIFLRVDGLLNKNNSVIDSIIELITHNHNDHVNFDVLDHVMNGRKFQRIIGPNPILETSRNNTFHLLEQNANKSKQNNILDIPALNAAPLEMKFTPIGDFLHSEFIVDENTTVEIFKYLKPKRDINDDGLIYQITHNGITQLLFGDIDDLNAIENLLDASLENEKRYYEINEELSNLLEQLKKIIDEYDMYNKLLEQSKIIVPEKVLIKIEELEKKLDQIKQRIIKKLEEQNDLPFLKADIVKWMHHAHVFSETRALDVINKLYDVVEPQYIIWQRYNNQSDDDFIKFIDPLPLHIKNKCLNSGERDIIIISLEWLINRQINLFS